MKRLLVFTFLAAFAVPHAWPQMGASGGMGGGISNAVSGQLGSLAFASGAESTNMLTVGVTASTTYNDNALSDNAHPVGSVGYNISPTISILESRPRLGLILDYLPGFTQDQRTGTQYSHRLFFDMEYRLTEALSLRVGDAFTNQSTTFKGLNQNSLLPGGNVLQEPNDSVITPVVQVRTNSTPVDLTYQPDHHTIMGVGGTFNDAHFGHTTNGTDVLFNSKSGSANAHYSHLMWGRSNWLGVTYTFTRIVTYGQAHEGTDNHSILFRYTFAPSEHTSISVFAGPRQTSVNDHLELIVLLGGIPIPIPLTVKTANWGVDAGATAGWRDKRNSLRASFVRRISDGGGLTSAVSSNSGSAEFRRQLSEHLAGNIQLRYAANNSLSPYFGNGSFRTTEILPGLQYTLSQHVNLSLNYARDHQSASSKRSGSSGGSSPSSRITDYDRVLFSISYSFTHPLGQ
jgi:hypothetical protein